MRFESLTSIGNASRKTASDSLAQEFSSCQGLIYSVLQRPVLGTGRQGFLLAIVAAHPEAGTTRIASVVTQILNEDAGGSALTLDCRDLATLCGDPRTPLETFNHGENALTGPTAFQGSWRGSWRYRAAYLNQLRERFSYVLIDCPSLKESTDILSLAPLVDGVLLVVEANRTQKTRVSYLERTIEEAGGKILGHLLNKRTYPIPEWVHNKLERWGI